MYSTYFSSYFLTNFLRSRYKSGVSFLKTPKAALGYKFNLSSPPALLYKNNMIFSVVSPPQSNDSFYRWMLVPFAVAKEPKIQLQKYKKTAEKFVKDCAAFFFVNVCSAGRFFAKRLEFYIIF